jgi:hypothetical protein
VRRSWVAMACLDRAQVWETALQQVGDQNVMGMEIKRFRVVVFVLSLQMYMQEHRGQYSEKDLVTPVS